MFIAAATVASDPAAYGLEPAQPGPRYAYDVAAVDGMVDLRTAADLAGTSVDMIRALNPELRQWSTPPVQGAYRLRLPQGTQERFAAAYAALPADQRMQQVVHRVRRGDTLGKIARRYGTSVTALREMNGLRGSLIRVGQDLHVPVRYERQAGVEGDGNVRQVAYDASPRTAPGTTTQHGPAEATPPARTATTHRVRRGDNLTEIARRYGVTVADLKRWNGLRSDRIQVGQQLSLQQTAGASSGGSSTRVTYRVRRGDNLTEIARRYGVGVADVRRWNDLQGDHIQVGQRLVLYAGGGGRQAAGRADWVAYRVKRGDTLSTIARRYGVTVAELKKWNALRTSRIQSGQRLAIYTRVRL
jgi:membrane-bound lytic murein transglycosylase D